MRAPSVVRLAAGLAMAATLVPSSSPAAPRMVLRGESAAGAPGVEVLPHGLAGMRPGIYLLRLAQSGRSSVKKVCIVGP